MSRALLAIKALEAAERQEGIRALGLVARQQGAKVTIFRFQ